MVTIIFESHATTKDNESHLTSSTYDVELSETGKQEAVDMGKRYEGKTINVIFCPNFQRSYTTAEIAFTNKVPILQDERLRECDYGQLVRHNIDRIHELKAAHITEPFPGGESIESAFSRIRDFLKFLLDSYDGETVMIIADHGVQQALEHWINHKPIPEILSTRWTWQPGWIYQLKQL